MILTEQPILRSTSGSRRDTWRRSDDVRRSIDVLDKVLSEFDDIDSFYNNENSPSSPDAASVDSKTENDNSNSPPPVDRSIKPRSSPPTLPKKTKTKPAKLVQPAVKVGEGQASPPISNSSHSSSNSQRSRVSNHSKASSHEYQEISSLLQGSSRNGGDGRGKEWMQEYKHQRQRSRDRRDRIPRGSSAHDPRDRSKYGAFESPLRKSKSGDMALPVEDNFQGHTRRNGRRPNPRRSRSIDRMVDPRKQMLDPRLLNMGHMNPGDPRLADPRFFNPRMFDPRFVDPRLIDPLLMDPRFDPSFSDPRLLDPRFLDHPMLMEDPRRYPLDDPMNFPHLLTLPPGIPGHFSLPPLDPSDFPLPHTIPRYSDYPPIHDPLLNPDLFMGQLPPPPFDSQMRGFDHHISDFDPSLMPPLMLGHPQDFPMGYPVDMPLNYPMDMQPGSFLPRELLDFDGELSGMNDPRLRGYTHPIEGKWLPPPPEEARRTIQRLVRNQSYNVGDGIQSREKPPQRSHSHSRRLTSTGHSDSSGTSSPMDDAIRQQADALTSFKNSHGGSRGKLPKSLRNAAVNQASRLGAFQVGEAVRKDGKSQKHGENSSISLPHFTAGGKDSGFDEIPTTEDHASLSCPNGGRGSNINGVGGGFVVAGVFSDSSKMYIPAPPSPTPDYDGNNGSDGDESDIPQEPFYVSTKAQKLSKDGNKSSSGSNRDSISDDSLVEGKTNQGGEGRRNSKETNSLQALIEEFHMGLPPPLRTEEGSYSDDSLEEESSVMGPSRPSTADIRSHRPLSMESLISMDGSTTSFDYVKNELHSKHRPTSKSAKLHLISKSNSLGADIQSHSKPKMKNLEKKSLCNIEPSSAKTYIPSFNIAREHRISSDSSSFSECSGRSKSPPSKVGVKESLPKEISSTKFQSLKHLIQEGLIEGLDETPPDFKPPPPSLVKGDSQVSSTNDERADSGMGSTASTNHKAEDSGSSDHFSDRSSTTPPKNIVEGTFSECLSHRRSSSPPPLPPPRDSSMGSSNLCSTSQPPLANQQQQLGINRNQSWLYKNNKRPAPQPNVPKEYQPQCSLKKVEIEKPKSRKPNNVATKNKNNEKITHIDDICSYDDKIINGNVIGHYSSTENTHIGRLDNNEYIKNQMNLELRKGIKDNLSVICEDQACVSSHGSKSGRFFSRLTESIKSNSRSNSPLAGGKCSNKNKDRKNNSSKGTNKFHGDIIRDPSKTQREIIGPLTTPPEFQHSPSSMVPLTRDGSGRFRSIEDLAEAAAGRNKNELNPMGGDALNRNRKKHSTLPPNLTQSDMEEQARENSRNRDEAEGSKFKLNIFKGFWRRNKYSFDKF